MESYTQYTQLLNRFCMRGLASDVVLGGFVV